MDVGKRWVLAAAALIAAGWTCPMVEAQSVSELPFAQRREVPPMPRNLDWVNTAAPLHLDDLRGKFVLLDFWTYCCINCMHILPELEKLEAAYPRNLVVIGVHSAKFEEERDTQNIVEAILRYKIAHPVINDADHSLWKAFRVQAWPTLILIDPEGYAVWANSGETTFEKIDEVLKSALPYYRKHGLLDETPLRFELEAYRAEPRPLRFPGKVLADEKSQRLFIADSGHNRIVVARLDGTLIDVVGSGVAGMVDGGYAESQWNDPQGMALEGEDLYVADTQNHAIRKIDLKARKVSTVAGTGQQRREAPYFLRHRPKNTPLSSPWDLCIVGKNLYVAMAGTHQIWRMDLNGTVITPYAGNGREDIVDGPLLPEHPYQLGSASFAQPSGLASDGTWLYVADSEGSSIRAVPLDGRGDVRTVVGTAELVTARLFTFGDVDGDGEQARLQHPLGVAYWDGRLYVADTYNSKIKVVDPKSGETKTVAGRKASSFYEPGGLSVTGGRLYVADTNHHQIRVIDLERDNEVSTLAITGLEPPRAVDRKIAIEERFAGAKQQRLEPVSVRPEDGAIRVAVELRLPPGYELNESAPMAYLVETGKSRDGNGLLAEGSLGKLVRLEKPSERFEIRLPVTETSGQQSIRVGLEFYYCRTNGAGICKAGSVVWTVPIRVSRDADSAVIALRHQVP